MPVTDAMLRNPDPADWLMIRRDYHASNYSPLKQITADNVKDLQLEWIWAMNEGGAQPARADRPQRRDLSSTTRGNILQALDARTGELIWENRFGTDANGAAMRGISLYDDKIFVRDERCAPGRARRAHRQDGLEHRRSATGRKATTARAAARSSAKGKVIQGLGGCQTYREDKCFISAYDAETGKQLWRVRHGGAQGEPGGDTWGKLPNLFRAGGETWITGSYDPDLNLTYWGTAQSKPWMPASRGMSIKRRRALHQLDARARRRHGQARRGTSSTRRASRSISTSCSSACWSTTATRSLVFTVGKDGVLWKLDRKTGKYLDHKETVFQNVWESFDPRPARPTIAPTSSSEGRRVGPRLPEHRGR